MSSRGCPLNRARREAHWERSLARGDWPFLLSELPSWSGNAARYTPSASSRLTPKSNLRCAVLREKGLRCRMKCTTCARCAALKKSSFGDGMSKLRPRRKCPFLRHKLLLTNEENAYGCNKTKSTCLHCCSTMCSCPDQVGH